MLTTSNTAIFQQSTGWTREEIIAAIAKISKIEKLPSKIYMSSATYNEFLQQYLSPNLSPNQMASKLDKIFGLLIILDEKLTFGKYRFE